MQFKVYITKKTSWTVLENTQWNSLKSFILSCGNCAKEIGEKGSSEVNLYLSDGEGNPAIG